MRVELSRSGAARVSVRAIDEGAGKVVKYEAETEINSLGESIAAAAEQLLRWCNERGWHSQDELDLERHLDKLRAELARREPDSP